MAGTNLHFKLTEKGHEALKRILGEGRQHQFGVIEMSRFYDENGFLTRRGEVLELRGETRSFEDHLGMAYPENVVVSFSGREREVGAEVWNDSAEQLHSQYLFHMTPPLTIEEHDTYLGRCYELQGTSRCVRGNYICQEAAQSFFLDRTIFPDGAVDCELVLEVPTGEDAAQCQRALIAFLEMKGIRWSSQERTKRDRLYQHLGLQRPTAIAL